MLVDINRRPVHGGAPKGIGRRRVLKTDAPKRKRVEPAATRTVEPEELKAREDAAKEVLKEALKDNGHFARYFASKSAYARGDLYNLYNSVLELEAPSKSGGEAQRPKLPETEQDVDRWARFFQKTGSISVEEWMTMFRNPDADISKASLAALNTKRNTFKTSWKSKQIKRILALWDIGKKACDEFIPNATHKDIAFHVFTFLPAHERASTGSSR